MVDAQQQARLAENEAIFREANEQIEARASELDFASPVPFLCECGEPACHEIVRIDRDDYAEVRSNPRWFFVLPDHVPVAMKAGEVVRDGDGYVVVVKTGTAGEVAERADSTQTKQS